jgi:hypothetical protein
MSIVYTESVDLLTNNPSESSSGVAVTTTGTATDVSKRQLLSVQFVAKSISSGNGVFTLDGSNDGTNWTTGLAMLNLTSTTPTTLVTSVTLSANGATMVTIPSAMKYIRANVTRTTDGTYYAFMENKG